jgi:Domain of unknown function (DUF2828)
MKMNAFVNAISNQEARTENGMKARASTASALVDFFFKVGASRGKNVIKDFTAAYVVDHDKALRIAQWARDARGGSGERKIFRDILLDLEKSDPDAAVALLRKVPTIGRWDDMLLEWTNPDVKAVAYKMIKTALEAGDGLCAKWMPRKGPEAASLRKEFGWTPKFYRKRLVELTKVVETQMCAKDWDNINFNHVPSLAASRYKKAFARHTPKYAEYATKLAKGDEDVKVNAGAVYPYDVLKGLVGAYGLNYKKAELEVLQAQWDALPNYVGAANILPIVDVSGSMTSRAGGYQSKSQTTCLDVSVSLGLYLADKNKGAFKDTFLTFSGKPELLHLKGNIVQKVKQMSESNWEMNTNLHAAFKKILDVAKAAKAPQEDMPAMVLILSDMQFDQCARYDDSAIQMIRRKYEEAGYTVPQVVFWNLNAHDNVPVKMDERGVALVSGFSPSIVKSVLEADMDNFTPEGIMNKTIMVPRYDI